MFGFTNPRSLNATQTLMQDQGIQPVFDSNSMAKYVTDETKRAEDGELISWGEVPTFRNKVTTNLIEEALAEGSYEKAMNHIEINDRLYYISHNKQLSLYFTQKFQISDQSLYHPDDFNIPPMNDILATRVLVFIGPTGIGKTQFALSHFQRPLHIRDKEDWGRYSNQTDGIVLDDLDFPNWSPLTFLKLLDMEMPITQNIKYGHVRIAANTPRIICCNDEDLLWPKNIHPETRNACMRRIHIAEFRTPLYTKTTSLNDEQDTDIDEEYVAECIRAFEDMPSTPELDETPNQPIPTPSNSPPHKKCRKQLFK